MRCCLLHGFRRVHGGFKGKFYGGHPVLLKAAYRLHVLEGAVYHKFVASADKGVIDLSYSEIPHPDFLSGKIYRHSVSLDKAKFGSQFRGNIGPQAIRPVGNAFEHDSFNDVAGLYYSGLVYCRGHLFDIFKRRYVRQPGSASTYA